MSHTYAELQPEYRRLWLAMQPLPQDAAEINAIAKKLLANKSRYLTVSLRTGVPWPVIGAIHNRESDADFATYLGNGQPLGQVTTEVPRGRGPFPSWEAGAADALNLQRGDYPPIWSVEGAAFFCEAYNGYGYRDYHNEPSPYLWAASSDEQAGKYVADGQFNRSAWDSQIGVMPLLQAIFVLDATSALALDGQPQPAPLPPPPPDVPLPRPRPPMPAPAPAPATQIGLAAILAAILAGLLTFGQHVADFIHHLFN